MIMMATATPNTICNILLSTLLYSMHYKHSTVFTIFYVLYYVNNANVDNVIKQKQNIADLNSK